jgi:membrane protein implicated in regulation of membrane protease activity
MAKHTQWTWRAARALVLGALLIGVNAVLIWTLEHTDIVAFAIVLLFSSLSVFALYRLLWPTLRSTHHIDDQGAPTGRSEAGQPQDQIGRDQTRGAQARRRRSVATVAGF